MPMSQNESDCSPIEGIPLEALVEELRSRREAVESVQGSPTHFWEDVEIFRQFSKERELDLQVLPHDLSCPPDAEGNEHQVWFEPETSTFLKATWPCFYGRLVLQRLDEGSQASPIDYLER